jgi:hypothetical protein
MEELAGLSLRLAAPDAAPAKRGDATRMFLILVLEIFARPDFAYGKIK